MQIKRIIEKQKEYPEKLKYISDRPETLWYMGELPKEKSPKLAIVGARNCSSYGKNMAFEFARILAGEGIDIISGLAAGVDGEAHKGAMAGGGKTFGIMGCGVDICYPAGNRKIYEQIKTQGGILSEYEPGSPPLAYHFPRRNRLISALSDAVLVIEAKEKSGSLITADLALEQGKTVFALPGRVGDLLSVGCNRLIYQGAVPAWKPEIILEEMNWERKKMGFSRGGIEKRGLGLAREDNLVYSCLDLTPKTVTCLQEETGLPVGRLLMSLQHLQAAHMAEEVWKNYYVRKP